jgi:phosphatidylserine/phosphatidylglycerophosphate/cardiolipin synthase-like enzyme
MRRAIRKPLSRRAHLGIAAALLSLLLIAAPFFFSQNGEMPPGTSQATPALPVERVDVFFDHTAHDPETNERVIVQTIFDEMQRRVRNAKSLVVADFFLWNDFQGAVREDHRALASEWAETLLWKKREAPDADILVLTDAINRGYGRQEPAFFHRMRDAGIHVVFTDLDRLPDSNPLYSAPARFYGAALSRIPAVRAWLDGVVSFNLLNADGPPMTRLQLFRLLHLKANHRKVLLTDDGSDALHLLVTSLNPADGSSAHDNIAIAVAEGPARAALASEIACMRWSMGKPGAWLTDDPDEIRAALDRAEARSRRRPAAPTSDDPPRAAWVTEGAIREAILRMIGETADGDVLRLGMFYLSERAVIDELVQAARRGVEVRLILDANKDAFGRTKNGIPNRPVARELLRRTARSGALQVRWADTHGEQFHIKAMSVTGTRRETSRLIAGSANWTRRNLCDLNLEANLVVENAPIACAAYNRHFDRLWNNADGLSSTLAADAWLERGIDGLAKEVLYRIQESSGLSTF